MRHRLVALAFAAALLAVPATAPARSLDFNGSATGLITNIAPPLINGATGLSVSVWLHLDATDVRAFIVHDNAEVTFEVGIDNAIGGGGFRFSTFTGGGTASTGPNPPFATGEWHHLGVSYDSTRTAGARTLFYLDGVQQTVSVDTTAGVLGSTTTGLEVSEVITTQLNGRVYNLKIWARPLSAEELAREMRCYRPHDTSALAIWTSMDTGDKVVPDLSGTGITWIPTGSVLSDSDLTPPVELCGAGG